MELYHVCPECSLPAGECRCEDVKRKRADDEQEEREFWCGWFRPLWYLGAAVCLTLLLVRVWLVFM